MVRALGKPRLSEASLRNNVIFDCSIILRTVVNYDFSLALNIDSRVAQARNRTLLLFAFVPRSRCPGFTQNFPIYNRSKYSSDLSQLMQLI